MPNYLNENGYLCYTRGQTPYSASHGWQDINYGEEERLVNEVVNEKMKALTRTLESALPRIVAEYSHEVFERLITSLVGALSVDVQTEVRIALSNAAEIFYGKKAQDYISKNIMNAMLKELDKVKGMKVKI